MYKFENYTFLTPEQLDIISRNYDVAINDDVRNFSFKLLINGSIYGEKGSAGILRDEDTDEIIKTEDNRVASIKFEHDLGMEDWTIGETPYGKLTVQLRTEGYTGIYNKGIELEPIILLACNNHLGNLEWIEVPYGVYYVDNVEVNATYTTLTAYDKMYKLKDEEVISKTEYPTTVGVALDELFTNEDTSDFDPYRHYVLDRPIEYKDPEEEDDGDTDELLPDDNDNLDDEYPTDPGDELPDNDNGCCDCDDSCCGGGDDPGDDPGEDPGGTPGEPKDRKELVDYYWKDGPKYSDFVSGWDISRNGGGKYTGCAQFGPTMLGSQYNVGGWGRVEEEDGTVLLDSASVFESDFFYDSSRENPYHSKFSTPDDLYVNICEGLPTQYIKVTTTKINLPSDVKVKGVMVEYHDKYNDPFEFSNGSDWRTYSIKDGISESNPLVFYLPNYFNVYDSAYSSTSLALCNDVFSFTFLLDGGVIPSDAYVDYKVEYFGYKGNNIVKFDLDNYFANGHQVLNCTCAYEYEGGEIFTHVPGCGNQGKDMTYFNGSSPGGDDEDISGASIMSFRAMSDEEEGDSGGSDFDGKVRDYSKKKLGEGMTKGELLGYIAGICGGNCYFDHRGNPRLLKLKYDKDKRETVYCKKIREDQISEPDQLQIGRAQCAAIYCSRSENEADDIDIAMSNNGNYTISIYNPFMTKAYLSKIADDMAGVSYYPLSVRIHGDPRLWVGDCVYMPQYPFKDEGVGEVDKPIIVEEGVYPIMSLVGSFDMGFGHDIESNCKSDSQRDDNYEGSLTQRVGKVEETAKSTRSDVSVLKTKTDKLEALVGYINQLFSIEVNANSVVTGVLNTKKVKIKSSEDKGEGLLIDGDSIDFIDRNKVQRIHIGSDDNQGEYVIKMTNSKGYTRTHYPSSGDLETHNNLIQLDKGGTISTQSLDDKDSLIMDLLRRVEELERKINEE